MTKKSKDLEKQVLLPPGLTADKVTEICLARRKNFSTWFKEKYRIIKENRKAFKNVFEAVIRTQQTFPLPITYGNIETIFSRLSDTIFGKEKTVDAIRVDGIEKDNEKKTRVENFANQEVRVQSLRNIKGKNLVKSILVDGIGIWRSNWEQEFRDYSAIEMDGNNFMGRRDREKPSYKEFDQGNGEVKEIRQDGEKLGYFKEYWTFNQLDVERCGWDPNTRLNVQLSPWFYEDSEMSLNDLFKWQEEGRIDNVEFLIDVEPASMKDNNEVREAYAEFKAKGSTQNPYADRKCYRVTEWWGELAWEEEGEADKKSFRWGNYHWFIVEDKYVIRFKDNELKPMRHPNYSCPAIIDPGKVQGMSVASTTRGIQKLLDRLASKQVELVDQASNVRTYYGIRSGLDGRTTFTKNQGLVPVQDVNQIRETQPNIAAISSTQGFMNWLVELMRDTSAANEQSQGIEGGGTATEFQGLLAAAGTRFREIADTMQTVVNANMAQEMYWMYKENGIPGQMFVREGNAEGEARALLAEDFEGDYEFLPANQQTEFNRQSAFNQDVEFLTMITNATQAGSLKKPFDTQKFIEEEMLPLRGIKNGATYFKTEIPALPVSDGQQVPQGIEGAPAIPDVPRGTIENPVIPRETPIEVPRP